jgi:hypothetical protein
MRIALMMVLMTISMLAGCAEDKPTQSAASATSAGGSAAKSPRNSMMGEPPAEPP